jgi:hypothetical protein
LRATIISNDLEMPVDDEDEDGFAINGEEHHKANNDDEFNDGIWPDEAFLKEIYQSQLALQKPNHPVPDVSVTDAHCQMYQRYNQQ